MSRIAMITGSAAGIGFATAQQLGKNGYELIITDLRQKDGDMAVNELKKDNIKATFYPCDATKEEDIISCLAEIKKNFDKIDVLVNCVGGLGGRNKIQDMPTDFFNNVMALNFGSTFFTSREALSLLQKGDKSSIVNFTSVASRSGGGPGAAIYAASKAAIEGLTRGMAKDFASFNIRVNAVSPGTIDTAFHADKSPEVMENIKNSIVMKRIGEPCEVANVIEFLVSEKASFMTGEIIQINGGEMFI
jgi:NAD(P)-dependent dehydrogenase (short-subunit alcohol dehydrogenase family)